jgi:hypothetical protein
MEGEVLPKMTHTLLLNPQSGSTEEAFHASLTPDLADQLDQVMQRDRSFSLQHPGRDYYVRPITPVEVLEGQALSKQVHEQARVLVGEVISGSRIRLTILDDLSTPSWGVKAMQQQLRHEITACTNVVEGYHYFLDWIFFGKQGRITEHDPEEQEKQLKYLDLVASAVILQNTVDISYAIRALSKEGYPLKRGFLATLSPYLTRHLNSTLSKF